MSRPQTIQEAVAMTVSREKDFGDAVDEFIDTFYLDHPNRTAQQKRITEPPQIIGDPSQDAWIAAVGEHLARRWGLDVPDWTRRPEHYALSRPKFVPNSPALRALLLVESPAAFRSRMIFTFVEPLQRARFPRHKRIAR
ncbi:hypothetical protein [Rhodopseudomonas sp.]|uniref:hypothetical protein n=1 Tax=Rhodopseudomonas sp. TaxID=1078 RepID=UPI0039E55621